MILSKVGEWVDVGISDVVGIRNGYRETVISTTNISKVEETINKDYIGLHYPILHHPY